MPVCTRNTGCLSAYHQVRVQQIMPRMRKKQQIAVTNAKRRARTAGVPCTLTITNIPAIPMRCPVLGIDLDIESSAWGNDNSAELDRIKPELGYTPENVHWISRRANAIKRNATPAELRLVADYFARLEG